MSSDLPNRVHDVDALRSLDRLPHPWFSLVDEAGLLAQWCRDNAVDWPTYRRQIGFPAVTRPAQPRSTT